MADSSHLSEDNALMHQVQQGDWEAFATLFLRYRRPLLALAESRLRERDWAEDVVQETFLAAFKSRHTFRLNANFRTWLWTILLHQCHRHYRDRQRGVQTVSWFESSSDQEITEVRHLLISLEPLPPEQLLASERRQLLDDVLSQLKPLQADALRLRFFGELKFREIADAMECSLLTAKNRVRTGLLKMAELLQHRQHSDEPYLAEKDLL